MAVTGIVSTGNDIDNRKIWNALLNYIGNEYGVAGIMGNMQAESGCISNNMQNTYEKKLGFTDKTYTAAVDNGTYNNFIKDAAGYGLCQWTYWSRKQGLYNLAVSKNKSIGDYEVQIEYLIKELQTSFPKTLNKLKSAASIQEASNAFLLDFERPASKDTYTTQTKRAANSQNFYNKFAKKAASTTTSTPVVSTPVTNTGKPDWNSLITTGKELAFRAEYLAKNYKTLYVMGCFGAPMNATNKTRYCNNHVYNKRAERTRMIKAASADTFGFDCVCMIKGLMWGWKGDASRVYGGAGYACNNVPDYSADGMINYCKEVTSNWSKIEVGEAVWCSGHIGVYIGNGLAVECTPAWDNRVQITAVKNMGVKSGYNNRTWTKHGKFPFLKYDGTTTQTPVVSTPKPSNPTTNTSGIKVGDKVKVKAGVTKFSNGTSMAKWVTTATLYVRAIESNGTVYLVSTEKIKAVYTGRLKANDVVKA